ncbi:MAG: hypothetical protein R6V83_06215 [Candidatus Thorarchaeota archaeon]
MITSPFISFLKDREKELAIVFALYELEKASSTQIAAFGQAHSSLPSINSSELAKKRGYLEKHGILQVEEGKRPTTHTLTDKGKRLGRILKDLGEFIDKQF